MIAQGQVACGARQAQAIPASGIGGAASAMPDGDGMQGLS